MAPVQSTKIQANSCDGGVSNEELTVDVISNWFILTPQHRKVASELLSLILWLGAKLFCFQAKLGN